MRFCFANVRKNFPNRQQPERDNYHSKFQTPFRRSFADTVRHDFHWKCLFTTIIVNCCILYVGWCRKKYLDDAADFHQINKEIASCSYGYNFIPVTIGLLLYLLYISECWNYQAQMNGFSKKNTEQIQNYYETMKTAKPIVWYQNGDPTSVNQIYYERVNSHNSEKVFSYENCGCKDISKKVADLDRYSVIKVRLSRGFVFACQQAANEFEVQRTKFFVENEHRDNYMEVREGLELADLPFEKKILAFRTRGPTPASVSSHLSNSSFGCQESTSTNEENNYGFLENGSGDCQIPWYMTSWVFWMASILILSWPLRIYRELKMAHLYIQVKKLFGTNYLSPRSVNYTCSMARRETNEFEVPDWVNNNSPLLVPSYSQAMLLDSFNNTIYENNFASRVSNPLSANNMRLDVGGATNESHRRASNTNFPSWTLERPSSLGINVFYAPRSQTTSFEIETQKMRHSRKSIRQNTAHLPRVADCSRAHHLFPKSFTFSEGFDTLRNPRLTSANIMEHTRNEIRERIPLIFGEQNNNSNSYLSFSARNPAAAVRNTSNYQPFCLGDDPPPSYEMAVRTTFVPPLFEWLRHSLSSASSFSLHSSSRNNFSQLEEIHEMD